MDSIGAGFTTPLLGLPIWIWFFVVAGGIAAAFFGATYVANLEMAGSGLPRGTKEWFEVHQAKRNFVLKLASGLGVLLLIAVAATEAKFAAADARAREAKHQDEMASLEQQRVASEKARLSLEEHRRASMALDQFGQAASYLDSNTPYGGQVALRFLEAATLTEPQYTKLASRMIEERIRSVNPEEETARCSYRYTSAAEGPLNALDSDLYGKHSDDACQNQAGCKVPNPDSLAFTSATIATLSELRMRALESKESQFEPLRLRQLSTKSPILDNPGNLAEIDFYGSEFCDGHFEGVSFERSNLKDVQFVNTVLKDVSFAGADLQDANFYGAEFREGVNFKGAKNIEQANFTCACSKQDGKLEGYTGKVFLPLKQAMGNREDDSQCKGDSGAAYLEAGTHRVNPKDGRAVAHKDSHVWVCQYPTQPGSDTSAD